MNVLIRVTKIDSGFMHMEIIIIKTFKEVTVVAMMDEVLALKDFGMFGALEFATYDWRN